MSWGGIVCIAFAACWLKLPAEEVEETEAAPARSLTAEWLLAVGILAVNYVGLRMMPERW